MTCIYSATSWHLPPTVVGLQFKLRVLVKALTCMCQCCDMYLSQKLYVFFWDDFLLFCISFAPSIHCYWSLNQLLILGNQRGSQDEGLPLFSSIELWYKIHIILHRHRDCKTLRGRNWKGKKGGKSYQRSGGLTVFCGFFFCFRWTYTRTAEFSRDPINISKSFCRWMLWCL